MKLDDAIFRQLRRLAPVIDDVLNAREVEHADQAVGLDSIAQHNVSSIDHPGISTLTS